MEDLIASAVIQGGIVPPQAWNCLWGSWHWGFWIGFGIGVIGAAVAFFLRPVDHS